MDCDHVYGLLLGFYEDDAFVLLFYLLCMIVLCMCCLSSVIMNNKIICAVSRKNKNLSYRRERASAHLTSLYIAEGMSIC